MLVRVRAASLNPADWKSGKGAFAPLLSFQWPKVYGFDFSGEVVARGPAAAQPEASSSSSPSFAVGEEVFGMIAGLPQRDRGSLAEYMLVDDHVCARKPPNVSHEGCAAVPLVAITAVKMLRACRLEERPSSTERPGPRVLITGGAGGVGTIAIQLARKMFGASFVATTASAGPKADLCRRLGASRIVNHRTEDFSRVLASDDESQLFDAALDCVGQAAKCIPLLKRGGALVSIDAGPTQEAITTWLRESRIDPKTILPGVRGFLSSRFGGSAFEMAGGARALRKACERRQATFTHVIGTGDGEIMAKVAVLLASGEVEPIIDRTFPLSEAVEAIEYQAAGHAAGKVLVAVA